MLKSETRQRCPLLSLLFHTILEVLARAMKQDKDIKGIWIAKEEVKLSSFVDNITIYIENPKESNKKLLQMINEFSKAIGYNINL